MLSISQPFQIKKKKFSFHSKQCVFIGYNSSHKGYQCLNLLTGKIYMSPNGVFNEECYPFSASVRPHTHENITSNTSYSPILFPYNSLLQAKKRWVLIQSKTSLASLGQSNFPPSRTNNNMVEFHPKTSTHKLSFPPGTSAPSSSLSSPITIPKTIFTPSLQLPLIRSSAPCKSFKIAPYNPLQPHRCIHSHQIVLSLIFYVKLLALQHLYH